MANLKHGGAAGTVVAVVGDLFLHGGEFVSLLVSWVVGNVDLLLPMLSTVRGQIAPRVAWLPTRALDKALFAAAVLFLLILAYRLVKRTVRDYT